MTGPPAVGRVAHPPSRPTGWAHTPAGVGRHPAPETSAPATPGGQAAARRCWDDRGNAVIEFVFLGVLLLAPLMYLVLAVSTVQRNLYGVTQAAREAGRAYATGTAANAPDRAEYAARLALEDQGLSADDAAIRYSAPGDSCATAFVEPPPFTPGGEFAICVSRPFTVPAVPGFLVGAHSSVTGRYIVHLDQYRDYGDVNGAP